MARDPWEELAEELVHGSEEEFVAALTERMMQLLVEGCENPDEFAAIASRSRELALGVWAEHSREVTAETEAAFMEALSAEQEELEATLAEAFGEVPGLTTRGQNEVNQAARGMSEILGRQNVALADNLADEWWHATSDAVTRIQMGDALQDVVRDGARRLAAAGLETIDYRSGVHTTIDAAVRRHAITQQNQCRNDMLVRECHEYGVDLVFTSAHYGARPEHAAWQGKPCGLDGPCEVDGVRYPGLVELTGYGTVTGLCGANCRHRLTPYIPGLSELPDTEFAEFEAKYHMSSDEYYEATQRQRALERQIRATKREIALGEAHGADMTEDRYRLGAQQKRLREHCRRTGLPRDYARERAYAAADKDGTGISIFHQPVALRTPPASSSRARNEETKPLKTKASAGEIATSQGIAVRDSAHLQNVFGSGTTSAAARAVESAMTSGDAARSNAAAVFAASVEDGTSIFKRFRMAKPRYFFSPSDLTIHVPISADAPVRTIVHEALHARDWQQAISWATSAGATLSTNGRQWNTAWFTNGSGYITALLADDLKAIEAAAAAQGMGAEEYMLSIIQARGADETYSGIGFLSDMVDAASRGAYNLGHGHHGRAYWRRDGGRLVGAEAFANYGGAAVANEVEYQLMREFFPSTTSTLDDLLEVMANG